MCDCTFSRRVNFAILIVTVNVYKFIDDKRSCKTTSLCREQFYILLFIGKGIARLFQPLLHLSLCFNYKTKISSSHKV